MQNVRIAVIGAGIAGLTAAVRLARMGFDVRVFERAAYPGGKLRALEAAGLLMDAGPTVFTLREVFDDLFEACAERLETHLTLRPASVLARHAWEGGGRLDLFADLEASADAIGGFAGAVEARGFRRLARDAERMYSTLEQSFMQAQRPSPVGLVRRIGFGNLRALWNIKPFTTLWRSLETYFGDPRLRQLFGRYATYCGSSPFAAPATLMLIAHVERAGVWCVDGGMYRLAQEIAALAQRQGARLHFDCGVRELHLTRGRIAAVELETGQRVPVDAVVSNADNNALAAGLFGAAVAGAAPATPRRRRSLSAITWNMTARTAGFALSHHTVFFGADYRDEFAANFHRRELAARPTIYVCAPDHGGSAPERLFCLINAPADGDSHDFNESEIESCGRRLIQRLGTFGLRMEPAAGAAQVTTPTDFQRMFPATGGALYGPASHGWMASFTRPGSRSCIPGLYLAGGSTHPGPGVPMAATSGRLAAAAIERDYASIATSRRAAMSGGTSMP